MLADRLAAETVKSLAGHDIQASVDVIELRDYAHDITNNLLTGFAPPALETAINTVVSADALIAVTPIFSTSYNGLFKSFIDVLDPDALTGKPVLIGANAGTARHRSRSTTRSDRSSHTCMPTRSRPASSLHPATGAGLVTRSLLSRSASRRARASWPRRSRSARWLRPPTPTTLRRISERADPSVTCSAVSPESDPSPARPGNAHRAMRP